MACAQSDFTAAAAPEVNVRALSVDAGDADIAAFVMIRDERPSDGSWASPRSIAAVRETLRARSEVCAIASAGDRAVGVGRCLLQREGLGEITSIVTVPDLRRRGVAAAVVGFLVRELVASGGSIAWLNAANEQAVSVYARLGFRKIGSLLNYEEASAGSS